MPDPRQKLYKALTDNNFDLGSYEEFNSKMDNPESRKKLYEAANANKFDLGSFDDFETKIGGKKKTLYSGSTSPDQKSGSAQKTGSSDGQTSMKTFDGFNNDELNSMKKGTANVPKINPLIKNKIKEKKLSSELSKTKVTPENMDQVSSKTDELSALKKESDAIINNKVKELETSFYNATQNNDDDAVAEQRLQDALQTKGIWNNVKSFAKNAYNTAVQSIATTNPGAIGLIKYTADTDPLSAEKKQIVADAKKNKEKLTETEVNERAKELFKEKEKENLFVDRANSFLDDLPEKDKQLLMQDRAQKADHLEEDNLKRLKVASAMRSVAENKISEYKEIESQLTKLKVNKQPFPEDLYAKYQSLGNEIQNIGVQLKKNEDYILENKKDLGTAQQEFDLFKREYGDLKNFVGNIGASSSELGAGLLGAFNLWGNMLGDISGKSKDADWQDAMQKSKENTSNITKSIEKNRENLRKPVESVESAEGFLNYASDLVANQLPILATTASGAGGLTAIGASSAGQKFTKMNDEVRDGKASYSPLQMATAPLLYGGAEMAGEYATLGILRKGGRVLESIARGEADLIKKTAIEKAKDWSKDFGIDMSKEMSGEQFTNFVQNFNDKYVLGKKDVGLLDNTGTVFKDTFTLTSILKAAPHVFGAVVKPFQSKSDLGKLDENSQIIIEFSRQLESEELTDTERSVIEKQIEKATAESSQIVANTIGKIDNMPTELYDKVVDLNTKAGEIKAQAREIADGNLSNKKQLLEGLQEDYKALQEQRSSIIEGKTSVVETLPIQEQEKLKKQAMEDLVTELNPDSSKDMTITNEQVLERANEIYSDSKNNETNNSKTEVNLPLSASESQNNGLEVEVNLPQNKKPTENRVIEYTNGKGEKATLNTNDIEISEDKNNKLLFTENGNRIGHIEINKPSNGETTIKLSGIFNPSLERKGIGTIMYKQAAELLKSKYNLDLVSDKQRTPDSEALWAKLEREGNAVVIGDKSKGNIADYQYKYVHNESAKKTVEDRIVSEKKKIIPKSIKELEKENKKTFPKVPTEKVFFNNVETLNRNQTKGVDEVINKGEEEKLPTKKINISDIIPTQKNLTISNLKETSNIKNSDEPILLVKEGDKYYVVDGHHRIANEILKGSENISAKVFINEKVSQENSVTDGNIRPGTKPADSTGEETSVQEPANIPTRKGEVRKKLQQINQETFGLDEKQSKASTAIMEKTLETMAKRSGISKEEMFDKITFQKGDAETAAELSKKGKALYQIVGKNAELSNNVKDNLIIAQSMEESGKNRKEIRLLTGWEKGSDGLWRYEIDDSKIKLLQYKVEDGNLSEVIDHPELFKMYPYLKDVRLLVYEKMDAMGAAFVNNNTIIINPTQMYNEVAPYKTVILTTILHEIQHFIQDKEGFAIGGSSQTVRKSLEELINKKNSKVSKLLSFSKKGKIKINEEIEFLNNLSKKSNYDLYESIAGEVEARNVETRLNLTPEERRNTTLYDTEDINRNDQIIIKKNKKDISFVKDILPETKKILFQGEQGAMLAEDGKFIIYALEDPNVSTPLHELAHVYEHYLTDSEKKTILEDAGQKEWSRETSEHFALGFEKYLADGIAPNPAMKKLFEDFKKWLTDIYKGITNSEIDIKISPEMQRIYDVMLGNPEVKKVTYKGGEFTIEKNADGKTKIFKKDGSEVKEFTNRKTKNGAKPVKNANYYKILAVSEGNMTENEINVANKKQIQESIDNFVPTNEYEVALLEIAKGTKFSKESLEKELGNKDSNWASDQFSQKKSSSIENISEGFVAENENLNLDEQEVRNALIDVIGSFTNLDAVKQELSDMYQKSIDPYYGLTEADAINAYEEFMTDQERTLFESVQAEENLSEEEKLQYYIDQYEKSIESIPAEDRAGIYEQFESEGSERLPNSPEGNEDSNSENGSEEKVKSAADQFLDWLDEIENNLDQFGKENLSSGLPIVVAKASIQAMRAAVKAGQAIADVIQAGLNAMKQSEWYQNLSPADKTQADTDFMTAFGNPQIDKENLRQTENLMNRSASENISEDEAFDEVSKTFEKERDELRNQKPGKEYLRDAYRNFVKRFTDRQYLSKSLLSKSGLRNTKNLMINAHGASGKAKILFEEAYNKIYKGLTRADRNTLDEIIQAKRFIAIDENRESRGLEPVSHPNFIDKNKSEKFLSKLEKNLGQEKYQDLENRAKEYFKTYKILLKQVYDNGLISKESYDSMSDVDYQPRVFLQFVTDFNGDLAENKRTNNLETGGLSSEQIKSMSEGDANSLVLNSEWLLTNSLLARQKAIAMNNINKRFMTEEYPAALKKFEAIDPKNFKNKEEERFYKYFKELSSKVIDNPYVGETSGGNPKFKYDKTPANFQKAYYYVYGKQHQFFLEQDLYDSWVDKIGGFLDSKAKEALSYASGSALMKGIATGNNPAFPIVNTPRDFMFTTTFSDQYSNFVPKAMLQVGKDAFKAFKELRKSESSDVLKKYIEYGGAMDFLSSEGRLKKNSVVGRAIEKVVDPKFKDAAKIIFSKVTLSKISEYSEMMFRLGIFQRSIKNQLKDLGLSDISEITDKQQLDDIYNEAVTSARSILDFNQGGSVTKDLEAVIPYINVAFQGGRVAATAFEKDPVGTTSRVLQMATLASAIPTGISLALLSMFKPDDDEDKTAGEIYLKAMEGISQYQKSKYMNIPFPIKDENGEYMVIKIAKAQELSPIMSFTDDIYNNMIRSLNGQEKKTAARIIDDAAFTFNSNVMPVDLTSPAGFFTRTPMVKGTLTYATGYDFFREEPLSNDIGKVPFAVEGLNNPNVEDFYKKLGEKHGMSPIRSKAFVESLITGPQTNPFVGLLYGGADAVASDKDMNRIGKNLFKTVYKSTGKRLISYPSDFNRQLATRKDLQDKIDKINIEKYQMKVEFNQLAKDYINKEVSKEEVENKLKELDPADRKRMLNKIKDKVRLQGIDGAILDIKYEQGNDAKALMIMHYYGDISDGSKDSKEILRQMKRAKGILTPGVIYEYKKLKDELNTKKAPKK